MSDAGTQADSGVSTQDSSPVSWLVITLAIAAAFVGFFVGIHAEGRRKPEMAAYLDLPDRPVPSQDTGVVPSLSYREMAMRRLGPNADFVSDLSRLRPPKTPRTLADPTDMDARLQSLDERTRRRAFDGAPPTVPHPIDQLSSASCMLCHGEGLRIGDRIAYRIPHEMLGSCTQCHVEQRETPQRALLAQNLFDGQPSPVQGSRAWPGAPPTIPHAITMRSDCLSCHGSTARPALQTSHPERRSCLQCHAPDAERNQWPMAARLRRMLMPESDG